MSESNVKQDKPREHGVNKLHKKSVIGVGAADKSFNEDLKKTGAQLNSVLRSVTRVLSGFKKRVNGKVDVKKTNSILAGYYDAYRDTTLHTLNRFKKICERFGVIPARKFSRTKYKGIFTDMVNLAKEEKIADEHLKAFFLKVSRDTKQTTHAASGFMDPYTCFAQSFLKVPLFLKELISVLVKWDFNDKDQNAKVIEKIKDIKNEMEHTEFKQFNIVNLSELSDVESLSVCINKLLDFSEKISKLCVKFNSQAPDVKLSSEFRVLAGKYLK